ncbi:Hypothetical_protein [Hexamita inflata]|uniref:Hypothetical_protein n=1 Tax=Hexamita inflata TaxID=28002 RepID=A0AA86QML3_9EUKA|nr:Hypothetical protein HINF_LOCUS50089 [Hexamita inflata]
MSESEKDLLEDFEFPESISESEDNSTVSFDSLMFKFVLNDTITAFGDNYVFTFDLNMSLINQTQIDFPHLSGNSNAYPAIMFGDFGLGIYESTIYKFNQQKIEKFVELPSQVNGFYSYYNNLIIYQCEDLKFKQFDINTKKISPYLLLNNLKLKEECALINNNDNLLLFQRFSSIGYVIINNQTQQIKLNKPGYQMIPRSIRTDSVVFEIDNKGYKYLIQSQQFSDLKEEYELKSWEANGKCYHD